MTVVPWHYDALEHRVAYRTDVIKARTGTEHRIALLGAPREAFDVTYEALTHEQLGLVRQWLTLDPDATYEVPLRHEALQVTAAVTGTGVTADATYADWVAAGQRVLVENDAGAYYTSSIASVGPIVLDDGPSGGTYAANRTWIAPLVPLLLSDGQGTGRLKVDVGTWHLVGDRAGLGATFGTGASLVTFDSYPVLDRRPAGAELAQEQVAAGLIAHDEGAAIATSWPRSVADLRRAHSFAVLTDPERQWWRALHSTAKGRQKALLLPTWRDDLHADATPAHGATTLVLTDIATHPYEALWTASVAHRRLQLLTEDGVVHYHRVTAVGGGGTSLTITPAFANAGASPIELVSLLETVRFEADELAWTFGVGGQAAVAPAFLVIQHTPDSPAASWTGDEQSVQQSAPVELYEFVAGLVAYRYTSSSADVSYGGHTYTAVPLLRTDLVTKPAGGDGGQLEVSVPVSNPFVQAIGFTTPPQNVTLTVYRKQPVSGATALVYRGTVTVIAAEGNKAKILVPSTLDVEQDADLPSVHFQPLCNHVLYDARCQVARGGFFAYPTTVADVDGKTVTVADALRAHPWFRAGELVRTIDGERRMIMRTSGTLLVTLQAPFRTLEIGDEVTAYAGCDGQIRTCRDKFDNVVNFAGFPFVPQTVPFKIRAPALGKSQSSSLGSAISSWGRRNGLWR